MKRWIFKLVVVLVLGAIVNVAVAWGCVWFWTPELTFGRYPQMGYVHNIWLGLRRSDHSGLRHEVQVLAGWPKLSLRHDLPDLLITSLPLLRIEKVLPYRPIWPGFASNTFFYAAILWLPFAPLQLRRYVRAKRGHCLECGYDLRGDFATGCPECGWRREDVP